MRVFADERHLKHRPKTFLIRGRPHQNREQPERALHLRHALERAGYTISPARDFGLEPVARVHTDRCLRFLQQAHARWCALDDAAPEVIPNAFPVAPEAGYPPRLWGRPDFTWVIWPARSTPERGRRPMDRRRLPFLLPMPC